MIPLIRLAPFSDAAAFLLFAFVAILELRILVTHVCEDNARFHTVVLGVVRCMRVRTLPSIAFVFSVLWNRTILWDVDCSGLLARSCHLNSFRDFVTWGCNVV